MGEVDGVSTSNPLLRPDRFASGGWYGGANPMTVGGVVLKTGILLAFVWVAALYVWNSYYTLGPASVSSWLLIGIVGGLVTGLVTAFVPRLAPVSAPLYGLFQGLFLGAISAYMEAALPGIVLQAIGLTFAVLAAMLVLYATGAIRVTQTLRTVVLAATLGIFIAYLASFILSFFGIFAPFIYGGGPLGIGFSLFVIGVVAFNLLIDFDNIDRGVHSGAPKVMEWYAAFGLMVSLIWLYFEILRLLSKLRQR